MRDVYDHTVQIIDIVETYREVAMGLTETYMTAMCNRLNEVMKVLTIIGTIFIPLTFLAGVYGMNFEYLPEIHWRWGYAAFWAVSLATAGLMIAWFRRRGGCRRAAWQWQVAAGTRRDATWIQPAAG